MTRCSSSGRWAATAAAALWDLESWDAVSTRQLQLARDAGALAQLATALAGQGHRRHVERRLRGKQASVIAEADAVTGATGIHIASYGGMLLAAVPGARSRGLPRCSRRRSRAPPPGARASRQFARWTTAVLFNGLGRYGEALVAARQASDAARELFTSHWALDRAGRGLRP
jgi:hypothetical protein